MGKKLGERETAKYTCLALCVLLISQGRVYGQTQNGSIIGSITDPNGALVPGVMVRAAKVYETVLQKAGRSESYHVFWYSSLRSRQAIARLGQLRGLIVYEQMKALALQAQNHYVLAISGSVARFFRYADLADLQSRTFLLSKRDKPKRIELAAYASPQALDYPIALFFFPRESNGRQLLELKMKKFALSLNKVHCE